MRNKLNRRSLSDRLTKLSDQNLQPNPPTPHPAYHPHLPLSRIEEYTLRPVETDTHGLTNISFRPPISRIPAFFVQPYSSQEKVESYNLLYYVMSEWGRPLVHYTPYTVDVVLCCVCAFVWIGYLNGKKCDGSRNTSITYRWKWTRKVAR